MTRQRHALLRLLGPEARLQSSYLPGRSGFVLTCPRSLTVLRHTLGRSAVCRIYPLHLPSGRFFLEPSRAWLAQRLASDDPSRWWSPAHQQGASSFFEPARTDRLRRWLAERVKPSGWTRGYRSLRELALRLESLELTPRPDKHWAGLRRSFDALWQSHRLTAVPEDPLWSAVQGHLARCRQVWQSGVSTDSLQG